MRISFKNIYFIHLSPTFQNDITSNKWLVCLKKETIIDAKKISFYFTICVLKQKKQIIFRILENILKDIHVHDDYSVYTYVITYM